MHSHCRCPVIVVTGTMYIFKERKMKKIQQLWPMLEKWNMFVDSAAPGSSLMIPNRMMQRNLVISVTHNHWMYVPETGDRNSTTDVHLMLWIIPPLMSRHIHPILIHPQQRHITNKPKWTLPHTEVTDTTPDQPRYMVTRPGLISIQWVH